MSNQFPVPVWDESDERIRWNHISVRRVWINWMRSSRACAGLIQQRSLSPNQQIRWNDLLALSWFYSGHAAPASPCGARASRLRAHCPFHAWAERLSSSADMFIWASVKECNGDSPISLPNFASIHFNPIMKCVVRHCGQFREMLLELFSIQSFNWF